MAICGCLQISRPSQGAAWGEGGPLKLTPNGWISLEPGQELRR